VTKIDWADDQKQVKRIRRKVFNNYGIIFKSNKK